MTIPAGDVLVAASPTLYRLGLIAMLRETWPALRICTLPDPDQLLKLLAQQRFALVIVDAMAADSGLLPQLLQLHGAHNQQRLVVLTRRRLPTATCNLLAQMGYTLLPRRATPTEVIKCVGNLLYPTEAFCCPARKARRSAPPTPFSRRELEVLRLVIADHCNQEIADRLFLSVRTVESHRRALLQKTGAKTLVGLVVQAMREGWVAA
ncbi:helix-turn-helix transcriptional regulator [Hymenobacter radiodurans]|uniref:helix-turn-helix transcriptional regulator n=1 Tax=Hymenobacter radiodurans TaxID=2496028 RepID=UPI00105898F5|nr:response regulator transcription factor [Hymenobacter radiodurans]